MDNFRTSFKFRFNNDLFLNPLMLNDFIIYQVGDLFCEYDTSVDEHSQDMQFELSFIERGKGTMTTNGIATTVTADNIYLSLKGDVHQVNTDQIDTLRYFYIAFDIKSDSTLYPIYDFFKLRFVSASRRLFHIPYIFPHITNILSEKTYGNEHSDKLIEANLMQILIAFYRHCLNPITSLNKYKIEDKNGIIYNIANYITTNVISIISLKHLSNKFAYDYAYISRKFKSVMGQSMNDYFQKARMNHAKNLLLYEKMSVTKTAEVLNYISINNFSRAFKNHFGISPTDFLVEAEKNKRD